MEILLGVVCVLLLIMVLGHGLWVFVTIIFSELFGRKAPRVEGSRFCVACGFKVSLGTSWCPHCGLDFGTNKAADLRDLEAMARQLQILLDQGLLDQETSDRVYAALETRQNQLLPETMARQQERTKPALLSPRRELELLLGGGSDVGQLTPQARRRALASYRQLPADELATLEPAVLQTLARLLAAAGLTSRALEVYEVLLRRQPLDEGLAASALQAVRLACRHERQEMARGFLQQALAHPLPPALQAEAQELCSLLDEPLPVILVEGIPQAERPPALGQPVAPEPIAASPVLQATTPLPAVETPPRRTIGQLLAVFMEERNILWGELVGGGLIVGCSVALVISLWQTLEQIPFFPFLILAAITAALFGAGFYTLSHWRLESTSRGLLVIATLLVPMDFVVLAGLSRGAEGGLLEVATEILALLVFGFLIQRAGGVLGRPSAIDYRPSAEGRGPIADSRLLLPLAVLGASASCLLVTRLLVPGEDSPLGITLLAFVPVGCQLLAAGGRLWILGGRSTLLPRQANQLLAFLGMGSFAAAVALGFLLYWCADGTAVLPQLALPVAVFGLPLLVSGAFIRRQIADCRLPIAGKDASHTSFLIPHSSFSAVALTGALILLLGLGLAWPRPGQTLWVGALDFIALLAVALVWRFPAAQVPALICLVITFFTAWFSWQGHLDVTERELARRWLAQAVARDSGFPLAVLAALLAGSAEWLTRREWRPDGLCHAFAAGFLGLAALTMVTLPGPPYGLHTMAVFGLGSVVGLLANLRWRLPGLSSLCGFLLLGGTFFWPAWQQLLFFPWGDLALALLAQATLLIIACLVGPFLGRRWSWANLESVFLEPFRRVSLCASLLTPVALVLALGWDWTGPASACLVWLAILWLAFAVLEKQGEFFAACQITLYMGVILGCTAWLQGQTRVGTLPDDLLLPRGLHAYGICLAVLGLFWLLLRLVVHRPLWLKDFLRPPWPAVDGVVLFGLILGQLVLATAGVYPGVERELAVRDSPLSGAAWPDWAVQVFEPEAWWAFGLLAVAQIGYRAAAIGYRLPPIADSRPTGEEGLLRTSPTSSGTAWIVGLLLLLLTGPLLAAGTFFGADRAVASACSWGLALAFVIGSLPFWCRGWLERWPGQGNLWPERGEHVGDMRRLLVLAAVIPVLLLTLGRVVPRLAGIRLAGPLTDTWFWQLGSLLSLLVPLGLVSIGLAIHGFRERFPGYLLSAGVIILASQVGGDALAVVRRGEVLDSLHWVRIVQTSLVVAAGWAILWTFLGRWLSRTEDREAVHLAPQLKLFLGGAWLVIIVHISWAILQLVILTWDNFPPWGQLAWQCIGETGSYLGWAGLGLLAFVSAPKGTQLISIGLLACGLLACTAESMAQGAGYPALQLASSLYLVVLASIARRADRVSIVACSQGTVLLVVVMAWSMVVAGDEGHLWGAASLALAGLACVLLAVQWQRQFGAFIGGLCFLQTAALIIWHFQRNHPVSSWFMLLIQVELIVAAAWALLWLTGRKWVYQDPEIDFPSSRWLALHLGVTFLGNLLLFVIPTADLLLDPAGRGLYLEELGSGRGWLSLVLALVAAFWYLRLVAPGHLVQVAGIGGMLMGVAAAGSVSYWDKGSWLCQHTLTMAWSLFGLLILTSSWIGSSVRAIGPLFWPAERRERAAALLGECFPTLAARRWAGGYGLLVAALALRGAWGDPGRPYWSCGATLAVFVLYAALALWSRQQFFVFASGLLLNLAGFLVWKAWVSERLEAQGPLAGAAEIVGHFVYIQVIGLALASASWSALEVARRRRQSPIDLHGFLYPFCQIALLLGLHLLSILIGLGLAADLTGEKNVHLDGPLAWLALATIAGALALAWWGRWEGGGILQVHFLILLAIGLLLHGWQLTPADLGWAAALVLGGYVLLSAVGCRLSAVGRRLAAAGSSVGNGSLLPLPDFILAQLLVAALVLVLSCWACLYFEAVSLRLLGPLSAFLLLLAAAVSYRRADGQQSTAMASWMPCYLTLGLGVVVGTEVYWAFLEASLAAPWLQRTAGGLVAVVLLAVTYRLVLGRDWASVGPWRSCGWQVGSWLGLWGTGLVLVLLVQELVSYDSITRHTPLVLPSIILAACAMGGLVGLSLRLALATGADPFGVPDRWRTVYVYTGEALLVLLLVHLRLNVPDLLPAPLRPYWPLMAMAVAFAGAGLAEWLHKKEVAVVSGPLLRSALVLPAVPLVCFLLKPLASWREELGAQAPGLQPLFRYLEALPEGYGQHALVWLLTGLLLAWMSYVRRSAGFGLLAALAVNFAGWVILGHSEQLLFWSHPQLWLIPLGLILLAAEFLYSQELPAPASLGLRYLGLLLIFLSSTADMFITGLGQSVLLPIVLALLSILGVLGGILFRVRAFLLGGMSFLFLDIFSQIYHAAVNRGQTWVWWASGIVLGVAILTMFALFEKHRNEVVKMIDDLKRWR